MTKIMTTILALVMVLLDWIAYRRLKRENVGKISRYSFCSVILLSYVVILAVPVFMYAVITPDNGTSMMKFSMAILTGYLFFAVCRMLLYAFWLPTRRKVFKRIGIVASSLLMMIFLYSAFVTRTDYRINNVRLGFDNLPESFDGFKIAFISDVHVGSMWDAEAELEKLSGVISSTEADVVLFGGDMVNLHHSELTAPVLAQLARIKGRQGSFAVMGNHDTGKYIKGAENAFYEQNRESLADGLSSAGWILLRDSTVYIKNGNDSIAITGIDYSDELLAYKHSFRAIEGFDVSGIYDDVPDETFNITLSHLPQLWHTLCEGGYSDLTLSGHIHAMQMKFAGLSPAAFLCDEWSGLYERPEGKLYINDGIGSVGFFARIGARPEVTLIELKSENGKVKACAGE